MLVLFVFFIARIASQASMEAFCSNADQSGFECFAPLCDYEVSCNDFKREVSAMAESPTKEQVEAMCTDGCLTKVFDATKFMVSCLSENNPGVDLSEISQSEAAINGLCSQNPVNEEYCFIFSQRISESFPKVQSEDLSVISNFTAAEKQKMCGMMSQAGCCAASFLKLSSMQDDNKFVADSAIIYNTCGWTKLPKACGGFGETMKSVLVDIKSDILWSDWSSMSESQKQIAQYAAVQDLKSTLDLEFSAYAFTQDADGKVVFHFGIDSTDDPTLEANVITALGSKTLDWSNLAAAIPGVDAVATANTDVKEEEVTRMFPDSSSCKKMPGFFVLSSVLFVWTFF